ncbi:hypothetical protein DRQ33_03015, partial [bacterium]
MRKLFIIILLCGMILSIRGEELPIFLKADSVQTGKVLRETADSIIQTEFVQRFEFSYVETVVAHDSICEQGECYPTDFETLRVVLAESETAKVPFDSDTIIIIADSTNLTDVHIPHIDIIPDSAGNEFFLWNNYTQNYCDTFYDKNGQTRCSFCGKREIFEHFRMESTATAILLYKYKNVNYPLTDSCNCVRIGKAEHSLGLKYSIVDNDEVISQPEIGGKLPMYGIVDEIIPEDRNWAVRTEPLIGIEFVPESLIIVPGDDTIIEPFCAIDGTWIVRYKWLWDDWAGPNETYTGYVSYWDEVVWGQINYVNVGPLQMAMAAPAQYIPTYAGDTIGYVDSIIAILQNDGIDTDSLYLYYPTTESGHWQWTTLRQMFYQNFDSTNSDCPIVFSRPVDSLFPGVGNICDNARQAFFCRESDACDASVGMRETGLSYDRQYFADAIHFYGYFDFRILNELGVIPYTVEQIQSAEPQLIVYTIGTGSVPRIWINEQEYIISPDYFPSYGDPYGFVYNGYKAIIEEPEFLYDDYNSVKVELIAPRPEDLGAQVVLALK